MPIFTVEVNLVWICVDYSYVERRVMCGNRETEEDLKGENSNGGSVMGNFQERPLFIHGQMNFCFEMVVMYSSKMFVTVYRAIWCHSAENIQIQQCTTCFNKDCILSAECVCGFCMILKSKRQLFP